MGVVTQLLAETPLPQRGTDTPRTAKHVSWSTWLRWRQQLAWQAPQAIAVVSLNSLSRLLPVRQSDHAPCPGAN